MARSKVWIDRLRWQARPGQSGMAKRHLPYTLFILFSRQVLINGFFSLFQFFTLIGQTSFNIIEESGMMVADGGGAPGTKVLRAYRGVGTHLAG